MRFCSALYNEHIPILRSALKYSTEIESQVWGVLHLRLQVSTPQTYDKQFFHSEPPMLVVG